MGLGDVPKVGPGPLALRSSADIERPLDHLFGVLRKEENFYLTTRLLLNRRLLTFQLAILRELWHRPFPMFIGTRGCGKSFLLGVYSMLRALLCQGVKIVI